MGQKDSHVSSLLRKRNFNFVLHATCLTTDNLNATKITTKAAKRVNGIPRFGK
jgi:hypothetical protein